jgi:hypothetical protein
MREPDLQLDGWCLEDGEARQRAAPTSFEIPGRQDREQLQPGDYAKLIFRISLDDESEPVAIERIWVLVRERVPGGYLGILDNDPTSIAENDELWSGIELPFGPHHVIDIQPRDEESIRLASHEPRRRWPH